MTTIDVKPCPFCGQQGKLINDKVTCANCFCEYFNEPMSLYYWQKRPTETELQERLEAAISEIIILREGLFRMTKSITDYSKPEEE